MIIPELYRLVGVGMVGYHGRRAHCVVAKRGGGPRHSCQESPLISPVLSGGRKTGCSRLSAETSRLSSSLPTAVRAEPPHL